MLTISAPLAQPLRYGENPHQSAALYGKFREFFQQLQGKELSYNNILDLTAAASLIAEFESDSPTLAILKHTNPCGIGQGTNLRDAWEKAFATDKQAPFGGIIAVNQVLDGGCAEAIAEIFSEVIVAPDFSPEALAILQKKKNLAVIESSQKPVGRPTVGIARRGGGFLSAAATGFENNEGRRPENRYETSTDRGRIEGDALWLAGGQACEVERDRLCGRGPDARGGRRSDEPGRLKPHRGLEGGRGQTFVKGQRGLQRCFFPFSGRFDCSLGCGCDGGHPARRIGEGCGSHCGCG